MTAAHIVFDITGHGLGHGAMSAPVLEAIGALRPDARITVRTSIPESWLRQRIAARFDYISQHEIGMAMSDGLAVDRVASFLRYRALHHDWPRAAGAAMEALSPLKPDLVVSNIGYLSLMAAASLGVRGVAYSSLNWADVFFAYCADFPGAETIRDQMAQAYGRAALFLQPAPSMEMPSIANGRPTAPVARKGGDRADEIRAALGLATGTRLAVVSFGGIAAAVDYSLWPRWPAWRLLVGPDERPAHPDMTSIATLRMEFIDILASADVLVIKPGYGLITEAAVHGKAVLYTDREGWPETPAEIAWLSRHGRCAPLPADRLRAGDFQAEAEALLALPAPPPPRADGARKIALALLEGL
jgi:hypothetical protein